MGDIDEIIIYVKAMEYNLPMMHKLSMGMVFKQLARDTHLLTLLYMQKKLE